jgi:hypothetical protein
LDAALRCNIIDRVSSYVVDDPSAPTVWRVLRRAGVAARGERAGEGIGICVGGEDPPLVVLDEEGVNGGVVNKGEVCAGGGTTPIVRDVEAATLVVPSGVAVEPPVTNSSAAGHPSS